MRPGKRPGNKRGRKSDSGASSSGAPPTWSLQLSHKLQRCIVTHDLEHILNWHTPAYTAAVAASLIVILVGASTFSGWVAFAALCAVTAMVLGGIGAWMEVESGTGAVLAPVETAYAKTGVRTKPTVESNLRTLYDRWVEPLLKAVTEALFPSARGDVMTAKWVVGLVSVTIVAELSKYLASGVMLALLVAVLFAITGIKKLRT